MKSGDKKFMAYTRKKVTKAGKEFYEIIVNMGPGRQYSTRWYIPEGWSKRAIDRELAKVSAEFERNCHDGKVLSRKEKKAKQAEQDYAESLLPTLKDYGEKVFMPAKTVTMSENSRACFQGYLDKRIYPALGHYRLTDITSALITEYLLSLQTEGLSHSTVIKNYTILNLLFKMAYLGNVIPRNPMDKVIRPKPRKDEVKQTEVAAYTAAELANILECLNNEPLKWRALISLMLDTGIRRGECCGLQWQYVDFKSNEITIAHNLCYTPQKGIYLDTPKNGKQRTIPVDPSVINLLKQWRIQQSKEAISPFVFTQNNSSEAIHPQSPARYLQKFAARYGIQDLHPHKLRHSFASVAITNGADIASISEVLGHSDKSVTLRMYTHADKESMTRAGNIFRDAVKNSAANGDA